MHSSFEQVKFLKSEMFPFGKVQTTQLNIQTRPNAYGFNYASTLYQPVIVIFRRCLKNTAPRYLSDNCIPVATLSGRSHLRSAVSGSLLVPACRTVTTGPRTFAVACPKSWNSLPQDLCVPGINQGEFRNRLKSVLFEEMLSGRL